MQQIEFELRMASNPIPPSGKGDVRCNIYKTMRSGDVVYEISVVLIASAAYRKNR